MPAHRGISTTPIIAWVNPEMDEQLARAIIELGVPQFGPNLKNKGDSPSCRFEPRHLLSSPEILRHIGRQLADVVKNRCSGKALVGLATSGIAWAAVASSYSNLPMLYLRKSIEARVSDNLLEGIPPAEGELILVDDLIFDGQSKRQAIAALQKLGFTVSDVVVIIDRQLQRTEHGPPLDIAYNLKLHSLINMDEIIGYMLDKGTITSEQLQMLKHDYTRFERWSLPRFTECS